MGTEIEKNAYLSALLDSQKVEEEAIFNGAKKCLQFQTNSVSYSAFCKNYEKKGWMGRKVIALPMALWSGAVKAIYHLVIALTVGAYKSMSDQGKTLKAQLFCAVRDAQAAFGRCASLANDCYGLYHIQSGQFHQTCYQIALSGKETSYLSMAKARFKKEYPVGEGGLRNALFFAKMINWSDKDFFKVSRFFSVEHFSHVPTSRYHLLDFQKLTTPEIKALIPPDICEKGENSRKLAQLSDQNFKIVMSKRSEGIEWLTFPPNRMDLLDYTQLSKEQINRLFPWWEKATSEKLSFLSAGNFKKVLDNVEDEKFYEQIPIRCYSLPFYRKMFESGTITYHLDLLDYDDLPLQVLQKLFPLRGITTALALSNLSFNNLLKVLDRLDKEYFSHMPKEYIPLLQYDQMSKTQIQYIFELALSGPSKGEPKFAELSSKQVLQIFDTLYPRQIKWITPEQLQDPDLKARYDAYVF